MLSNIIVSLVGGILFGIMDGLINANPLAQKMYEVYKPLARKSLNLLAGILIDLVYGFVIAGVFLLLYHSLPGDSGVVKGLSLGILVWFFRVVMSGVSQWVMYVVPVRTIIYSIFAGMGEMLILGILYGLFLKPLT